MGVILSVRKSEFSLTDVVIGSGPCGYAAALAITKLGRHPLIIDFGPSPSFESAQIDRKSTVAIKGEASRTKVFDYPRSLLTSCDGKHLPASSARGGLSNIWGAGILLRQVSEVPQLKSVWDGIEDGYQSLLNVIPHVGAVDRTSERFPWSYGSPRAPQSERFATVVEKLQESRTGVLVGWPRVALDNNANKCVRCGECLHGCPLNLFFSSRIALEEMVQKGLCSFRIGPVLSLERKNGKIYLNLPQEEIHADRVFIAAGPIATPMLLQRSKLAPKQLTVRDSAVFYTGFFNKGAATGREAEYTSSHFVAYSERAGEDDFQLAIYESNPEYANRLGVMVPWLSQFLRIPSKVVSRINAGIGFLDSSVSGSLNLNYSNGRTWVSRNNSEGSRKRALAVIDRVAASTRSHGIYPFPRFVLVPPAGSGYHSGASMPMGGRLIEMNGALKSADGVYVVDSSVLPQIWAGSHTFTAMANAYRIVKESQ